MFRRPNWFPTKTFIWFVCGIIALFALVVVPVFLLNGYCSPEVAQHPIPYKITEKSNQTEDYGPQTTKPPVTEFSRLEPSPRTPRAIYRSQTTEYAAPEPRNFWNRFACEINGADYTMAAFTVILALSTIALWLATRDALKLGKDEFVATHRPRLVVRKVRIDRLAIKQVPIAWITIANIGDGTARIAWVSGVIGRRYMSAGSESGVRWHWAGSVPKPGGTEYAPMAKELNSGERAEYLIPNEEDVPLSESDHRAIMSDAHALCVWGEICYFDTQTTERHTGFFRLYSASAGAFRKPGADDPNYDEEYAD